MFSSKDYRLILRDRLIERYGKNYNKIIAGKTIKIPSIPVSYQLEYERKLISFYKDNLLKNILNRVLFRIKQYKYNLDSLEDDLENDIEEEINQFNNKFYNLYPVIQDTGNKVFSYSTSKYEYALKIALGVSVLGFQEYQSTKEKISKKSIKDYIKNFFFNPKEESFNTKDFVDSWTKENVNLIKGATDDIKNKLKSTITRSFRDGSRSSELFEDIKKITNYGDNRVRLIARDQTSKLYGQLNRQRSQDLGLEYYIWRGVLDERERPKHVALEGKIRKWGEEEFDPGDEIRCRCTGESVITEDSFDF